METVFPSSGVSVPTKLVTLDWASGKSVLKSAEATTKDNSVIFCSLSVIVRVTT